MRRFILALLITLSGPAIASGAECHEDVPCFVGDRSYHIKAPDNWDGVTPLPVLMHFHGWMRQGTLIVKHGRISGATRRRGVVLLAPNGRGKTWDFWSSDTPDVDFAAAVIEDAARRYPIDKEQIFVSGYSYGAAMAWRYVCENGDGVAALLAVAGTLSQTESCPQAPREVRHVHGKTDTVMDFPIGPGGDGAYPVALWRQKMFCSGGVDLGTWKITRHDVFARTIWDNCESGRVVFQVPR